jgi:cell division transport system permease protein
VLAISLYVISVTIILGVFATMVRVGIQDKINVSVYFKSDVAESRILEIKDKLIGYQEIQSIDFVSKEKALEDFKKQGERIPSLKDALAEFDGNPLLNYLVIKAKNPSQYETIANAVNGANFSTDVDHIDYQQNKAAIDRLTDVIKLVEKVGLSLGLVFVFIGVLITFNAIRLTMYAHKQEFEIMRLVGASNTYIKMPFVFEGILYGLVSAITVMILLGVTVKLLAPLTQGSAGNGNIVSFYLAHFFVILGGLLVSGIVLGTLSSMIAIRRYLKI